mgnify:CR=1 FL=1
MAGNVGPKSATTGVAVAAATCIGPLSGPTSETSDAPVADCVKVSVAIAFRPETPRFSVHAPVASARPARIKARARLIVRVLGFRRPIGAVRHRDLATARNVTRQAPA